ncbi:MAG: T9SS type A sorting domain-containing protein [Flavobacteriales bacterium]
MKMFKTLFLLLLTTGAVLAQPNPDDLFINGTVSDANGTPQAGVIVCVDGVNSPIFPLDSLCALTDANGYYYLEIPNGSTAGPNMEFILSMDDPCPNTPGYQTATVSNEQGTVDVVDLDWTSCASSSANCDVSITASNDSLNGTWTFVASPTGTAPFAYDWWVDGSSYSTQTVNHTFNGGTVGVSVSVTDANGCVSNDADTLFLGGGNNGCGVQIGSQLSPNGGEVLTAYAGGTAPFTYSWSNGSTAAEITVLDAGIYCVTIADANGCQTDACYTVVSQPACEVDITVMEDSIQGALVYTLTANPNGGSAPYSFLWSDNQTTQSISVSNVSPNGEVFCVTTTDASGCTATACDTLLPPNVGGCYADFTYNAGPNGVLYAIDTVGLFYNGSVDASNSYAWTLSLMNFSYSSSDMNPEFVVPPTLVPITGVDVQVCVTVTNGATGCTDTYCEWVTVVGDNSPSNCDASFTNSGLTPIGYTFSANVQSPSNSYFWEIDGVYVGDGYEAYSPGFVDGTHTICLTLYDSLEDCSDMQCQTIVVGNPNNCQGYVSGAVYAGSQNQPLDEGVVYLIQYDSATNALALVDSMVLDSGNWYFFGPLDCGDYLVKAAATSGSQYYAGHIPTYFGNSPFWGFAQAVTADNSQVSADVTLIAANNPGGPGFIGGDVTEGANKTDPGDGVAGMQVMIFNLNGDAIAYAYTDANGAFGFSDLAYGTYQVYVEALGVQTIPAVVTISPDNSSEENVHIFTSESLISTGIEEFDFEGAISDVYPNPVVGQATIKLNLDAALMINVSVLDLTGRTMSSQTVSVTGGENTIRVNADELKNGYYFLNIQDVDANFSVTRKFMRID